MSLKEGIAWSLFFLSLGLWGFYLGFTSPTGAFRIWQSEPQDVILYTENEELAHIFEGLHFQDWNLKTIVIDEPTEWEIKTVAGHGAHLVLVEHALMEQLNRVSLLENAKIRVPLFSFLYPDFRKQDWEKVYLPLFWKSEGSQLKDVKVWGFSVPQNSPDRKLSWKAFYELISHPNFKAYLMKSQLGLTLAEFEESTIPATRKPSFVRQRKDLEESLQQTLNDKSLKPRSLKVAPQVIDEVPTKKQAPKREASASATGLEPKPLAPVGAKALRPATAQPAEPSAAPAATSPPDPDTTRVDTPATAPEEGD